MKRAILVRNKVAGVVNMLTNKSVRVTQQGTGAYTEYNPDGSIKRLNLPYIQDDASDDFLDAIEGYLDHEVGHVLFTDVEVVKQAKVAGVSSLHNLIEDTFIERMMAKDFRGSQRNLDGVARFFLKNHTDKMIAAGGTDVVPAVMVPMFRALAGQTIFKDYMDDKWEIVAEPMARAGEYLASVLPTISSSEEALNVAVEAKRLLQQDSQDPHADQGEESQANEAQNSDESDSGQPQQSDQGEQGGQDGSDGEQDLKTEGDGDSPETQSEDDGTDAGSQDPKPDDSEMQKADGQDGEGEGEQSPRAEQGDDKSKRGGEKQKDKKGARGGAGSIADSPELSSFDDAMDKLISTAAEQEIKHAKYAVWSTDYDTLERVTVDKFDAERVERMQDKVDHMVGPMQKDLERAIAARSKAIWSPGHRSGRLYGAALSRLTVFDDDRAFRRKHEIKTNDVAVTLLIDCSGSMWRDGKIRTACNTAYAIASTLDRIRVSSEILGFTTGKKLPRKMGSDGFDYARDCALEIYLFKDFAERTTPAVKSALAKAAEGDISMKGNVDGESLLVAAGRLIKRREARKILIVLSDGMPAASGIDAVLCGHLKDVVGQIEKTRVEVLGIGIKTDAPRQFYPKCVVLNTVSELPRVVMGEVKKLLTG